jgi:SpoVK/Ycf46/Vps4 family AAA+-type ATPase
MATAIQIKALLNSVKNKDKEHLCNIALQIAAKEEEKGRIKTSNEIKEIIKHIQEDSNENSFKKQVVHFVEPVGDLKGLLEAEYPSIKLNDLILNNNLKNRLNRIITEQNSISKLREFNLLPRSKILLAGLPGTGKTLTAKAIAGTLKLPVFTIQLDKLITKYMGETSVKLRLIFDYIKKYRGVYFFDEFDALGSSRSLDNDVGEIRRVMNTLLQFIEQASSESLIIAATNHIELLDKALFRRFDDILEYILPEEELIEKAFRTNLHTLDITKINWDKISKEAIGLSFDDIVKICSDIKKQVLLDNKTIDEKLIKIIINEKRSTINGTSTIQKQ